MLENKPLARLVAARLQDFFSPPTPWARRLWSPGLLATLSELATAAEAERDGIVSKAAVANLSRWSFELAVADRAVPRTYLQSLRDCLLRDVEYDHGRYHRLLELTDRIREHYLERWGTALRDTDEPPGPELASRSIAGHLLRLGFSAGHLLTWWSDRIGDPATTWTLADLVEEAHASLAGSTDEEYEVVIPFIAAINLEDDSGAWMTATETAEWVESHGVPSVRQNGALRVSVTARDPVAAVERAAEAADRLLARGTVLGGGGLVPHARAWVAGLDRLVPMRRARGVRVGALQRVGQPLHPDVLPVVDAAIALVAPLQRQPPASAVAGAWAAMESLLMGPGEPENISTADRMASLVACSLPRAELTRLARVHAGTANDPLAAELGALERNRDKAARVLRAIREAAPLSLPKDSDRAALRRVQRMTGRPKDALGNVRKYVSAAFRRLYIHRNLVLHGGRVADTEDALRSALDIAAPLVGAGLDRIVHAQFEHGTEPRTLAGKAEVRLAVVGEAGEKDLPDLLE